MADPTFDLDAAVREANPEPEFDLDAAVREAGADPREAEAAGLASKKYAQNTSALTDAEVAQLGAQAYTQALARGESEETAAAEEQRAMAPFSVLSGGDRAATPPTGSLYDTVTKGAIPVGESATERDQRWRDIARQSSVATVADTLSGTAGVPSREEIEAAGLDIPWTDKAERLAEKVILAPGSPIATAVAAFGGDTYGVPTFNEIGAMGQEALDLAAEYGADPGVQKAVSPEEWFGAKGAVRLTARTGTLVAPYVQGVAEKSADVQEAVLGDIAPEYVAKLRSFNAEQKQQLEDAIRLPAFDSAAAALYLGNDRSALDAVPYRDIPPSMQAELPFTLMYQAVSPGGALADAPEAAKLRDGVARGTNRVWLENEAARLPVGLWRAVMPDVVPSDAQVIEAHTRRDATQKMTGSNETDGILRVIGAGMVRRDDVSGQPVFVPSRMARAMAFAGAITEGVNEADIPLSWTPTAVGLEAGATALGFNDFAKAVSAARIPTKAGWESWVATGTLDPYLEAVGYEGSRAPLLRPGQGTTWAGRVAANIAMPDYQGLGLTDTLRRQGEAENSWIMDAAKAADVGYDFFLSPEDEVFHLVGIPMKGARRGWAAYNVAGEAGLRGAERAGVVGRAALGADTAAVHAAVKDAVKREVLRGAEMFSPMKPDGVLGKRTGQMHPYAQRAVADNIASVGADPQEVFAKVNDLGVRAQRVIVDDAATMLARRGGPADVALRTSPEYRAVKDAYVKGVREGKWSQAEADTTMALLEANAWRRVEAGEIDDPVKAFAEQRVEMGGAPGAGAYFQKEGVEPYTGAYERPLDTELPSFKRWFGDSKVTTQDGAPQRMYHGSGYGDIKAFDPARMDPEGLFGPGFYFTENPEVASSYVAKEAPRHTMSADERRLADLEAEYDQWGDDMASHRLAQLRAARESAQPAAAGPGVLPVYLSIMRPFDMDAPVSVEALSGLVEGLGKVDPVAAEKMSAAISGVPVPYRYGPNMRPFKGEWAVGPLKIREGHGLYYLNGEAYTSLEEAGKAAVAALGRTDTGEGAWGVLASIVGNAEANEALKNAGYDGITHIGGGRYGNLDGPSHRVYIAFSPEQIKSAVANVGTFDPKNPSILHSRTGPTIHGSIEPSQAAWLIRYFHTADFKTILHENAHLLRFTMGDKWVDDLSKFFDHDANGLTRKGEEQFAEAMTRLWNYKIKPNGAFRAYADELTDTLSDLWMRVRGLPMGVPQGFRVWHDATLEPAAVLRDIAVAVNPDGVPRATPRVGTAANPYERAARETVKRRGALVQDVGVQRSVGEHIDALGLTRDQETVGALDLAASAIADHAITSYRRMWGTQGDVVQVSSRAVVPALRKPQVLESARLKMAAIFGGKAPEVTADGVVLTTEDAARMKAHVEWIANTGRGFETLNGPSGRDLLRPDRDFTHLTHGEYEAINDATITLSAGPGSGRDVRAERVAGNFVVSAFAAGAAAASRNKQVKGVADTLKEWFVVNWKIAEYANPQIAEVSAESARLAGDISAWVLRTADRVKKLTPDAAVEQIVREVGKGAPAMPVQPEDVELLATLYDRYIPTRAGERVEGLAEGMEEAPPATIGDLLHDLPDVTRLFARSTSFSHDATEAEHGALVYLASIRDYDAAALTPEVRSQIEDALAVVHDGLRRRSEAVEHGGLQVALGFSGQPEAAVLAGLNAGQARKTKWAMYQLWHQGRWVDIFAGNVTEKGIKDAIPYLSGGVLAANMASKGFATAERSGFDQVAAALACVTRMRSQHILVETFERMMDLGIPLDVETAARTGRQFETLPLLGTNPVDRAAFREDVKHYLTAISNWSMTTSTLFSKGGEYVATIPSPSRVAPSGMFNPEAYQTATRILDAWGYRFGQDVVWTTTVLPNGVETFVPSEWLGEIEGAIDRGAKAGLAWTAAADDPSKVLGALTPGGVQHRLSVGGRVKAAVSTSARDLARASSTLPTALGRGVATVLSSALDGLGFVYATSRIGMTTGFLMPNPANFVGNTFGGLLQMLAGKGAVETTSALATYLRGGPRADYLRQLFLRTFRDTRGAPFASIWERKGAVWLDGRGAIHTTDSIGDDIARLGLRSSMAHAESGVKLLEAVKDMDGTFWHRITHDPLLETFVKRPVRYWQSVITEISGATDNFYRCAAYVDELARGATKEEAAAVARRVAFDYGAATEFEKETLRPIVMFYMYQRRNVDLFWWTLLNRPSRVLGTAQGIRKLQQYIVGDDHELVWPEYLDPRAVGMFRAVGVDSPMADSRKGVATVLPPFPTMDALGLHIRLWSVLNGEPEGMRETFSMLSPFAQAMVVLGLRKNPYSDRDIEREATIPQWFMDIDYHLTGGHVVNDVFGARWEAVPDPETDIEGEYNTGRWMAKNAGAWWTARTLIQIPPFGRAMDTISKMNQADSLAWAFPGGFVTAAEAVGPLAEPVPEIKEQMEAIGATPTGLRRTGVTEAEEMVNALGLKTIPVDTEAMGVARKEADRARRVREAQKEEERGAPHRYGR